ncbi:uncharacterized protein LOC128830952 isoform X3 [Malaclemys terrapin pileata]|uniref:uncharacterized protein LOC128830952 isoform X3 n=1 Tax=Malaclemys terrapin pileata TaxID=2991368 RepID=UPI0023A82662|nr:uncharacterized protein LOC128830952 isoform X3 [Malaclemys terrapin pileata]
MALNPVQVGPSSPPCPKEAESSWGLGLAGWGGAPPFSSSGSCCSSRLPVLGGQVSSRLQLSLGGAPAEVLSVAKGGLPPRLAPALLGGDLAGVVPGGGGRCPDGRTQELLGRSSCPGYLLSRLLPGLSLSSCLFTRGALFPQMSPAVAVGSPAPLGAPACPGLGTSPAAAPWASISTRPWAVCQPGCSQDASPCGPPPRHHRALCHLPTCAGSLPSWRACSSLSWGNWMPICPRRSWTCSLSLCELQPCDPVSTSCVFQDGLAQCPCRPGYRPALAMGRACAACGSGFWLRDGVCARCPFGFGGFQCEEPFLLALVGVSCAGGVLLLLLLAALLLLGRAKALAQRPSLAEPVVPPFQPQQLSLPRVRPPRPLEEVEIRELGHGDRLGPGRVLAAGPRMKTFQGSQSSPGLAPRPGGGQSNLVFVSDEEWGRRKC